MADESTERFEMDLEPKERYLRAHIFGVWNSFRRDSMDAMEVGQEFRDGHKTALGTAEWKRRLEQFGLFDAA